MVRSFPLNRIKNPLVRAEVAASGWELFSALLFASAVIPAALGVNATALSFLASMVLSALLGRALLGRGERGFSALAVVRVIAWPLSILPLLHTSGLGALVAALAFGLMAGSMRRAIYRRVLDEGDEVEDDRTLRDSLRPRLTESATTAGIVGGHVMLLFSVAFLRTQSDVMFRAWFQVVPVLALLGTLGFALAVWPLTRRVIAALSAGESGDRAVLARGLRQATALPSVLSYLNFCVWLVCSLVGGVSVKAPAKVGDAIMQITFGVLFSWGVSFYQRAWHRETCAPAVERLSRWTGIEVRPPSISLEQRMMRDFGLPALFMGALSLFSSIGLYRALAPSSSLKQDISSTVALFASFTLVIIAVAGVVARAARELSRPMAELASRADLVAKGNLEAPVLPVKGPVEVVGLGESVERMRDALARTIAELSKERAGLEANVLARTAELSGALEELKRTQAALIQGERLASIGELVSGVAHEIYNPLNAIAGAAAPLTPMAEDLRRAFAAYREVEPMLPKAERERLAKLREEVDLDASLDDLAGIGAVVKRAVDRSVKIVGNLKNFSRSSGEAVPSDLSAGLEETLLLLGPRLRKAGIAVVKEYGSLPPVVCRIGEMNQVFMNLLVNAIQALEGDGGADGAGANGAGANGAGANGAGAPVHEIRISTTVEGSMACIAIADSGPGVPEAISRRIFDPFFTTKPRGHGTGLGLSISTDIVRRHGGTLSCEPRSSLGGAKFLCRLPLSPAALPQRNSWTG
jgi:signal transduction histidine kinase